MKREDVIYEALMHSNKQHMLTRDFKYKVAIEVLEWVLDIPPRVERTTTTTNKMQIQPYTEGLQ